MTSDDDAWNALMKTKEAYRAEADRLRFEKVWIATAARQVMVAWEHARVDNEPLIDALVNLREALSLSAGCPTRSVSRPPNHSEAK